MIRSACYRARSLVVLGCLASITGVSCKEHAHNPTPNEQASNTTSVGADGEASPQDLPPAPPSPASIVGLTWEVPESWSAVEKPIAFRLSTWAIPVRPDDPGSAILEASATYFGPEQGGAIESNMKRWSLQVRDATGAMVKPTTQVIESHGLTITVGRFNGRTIAGLNASDLEIGPEGVSLIGAIVDGGPKGRVFFRVSGFKDAVDRVWPSFEQMLRSIRIAQDTPGP